MTVFWLAAWMLLGRSRPEMFGTRWDMWGLTLAAAVVFDTGWLRDWRVEWRSGFTAPGRVGRVLRFLQHFAEMGIAMVLGMYAMGLVAAWLGPPETRLLAMALFMAAPMVAWMRLRGHGLGRSAEMAAAMLIPALLAVGLRMAGVFSVISMREFGHDLMWSAMLGLMLWRWPDYSHHAHGRVAELVQVRDDSTTASA